MGTNPTGQCLLGTLLQFIAAGVVGPLPETESARQYLLVAMDFFRKWPEVYPKRNQDTVIATKLLRDEFFTIFGDQDTENMQQGRGFDAKVFQQVCRMLVKTIGGIQHPKGGREEKLGWCWEEALRQLRATWPEMPPFTLPGLPVLLLKAWVPALCQHLRDLSVSCTAPKPREWATESAPRHFTREWQKDQDWSSPLSLLLGLMTFSAKGKRCLTPVLLVRH